MINDPYGHKRLSFGLANLSFGIGTDATTKRISASARATQPDASQGYGWPDGSTPESWYPLNCGHCGADAQSAVVAHRTAENIQWLLCPRCFGGSVVNEGVSSPHARTGFAIEGLPQTVNLAYQQARDSFAVSTYTGVELICRKILMHVAVDKGAEEGKPFASYIEYLAEQGYVTPTMRLWVNRIKDNANEATHRLPESTKDRAQSTLVFTAEPLRLTYEMEHMTALYSSDDWSDDSQ